MAGFPAILYSVKEVPAMKRFLAFCIALCCVFCIGNVLAESTANETMVVFSATETTVSLCRDSSSDSGFYLLTSEALYHWDSSSNSIEKNTEAANESISLLYPMKETFMALTIIKTFCSLKTSSGAH